MIHDYTFGQLRAFLAESNRIEGIHRDANKQEMEAVARFIDLEVVTVPALSDLVKAFQPGAVLRDRHGLNVYVGDHRPEPGGPLIVKRLTVLLEELGQRGPWNVHQEYEHLHPFTDGNGRSGRMLWAWQMLREDPWPGLSLGFLHAFYYQTLQEYGKR